jgi:hypothetical protein
MYQGFGASTITLLLVILWILLLFLNMRWWIIFVPITILVIPLSRWAWYQSPPEIIPEGDPASVRIFVI